MNPPSNIPKTESPNGATSSSPASGRADLRPENIQDAVIRLAGNSQDGIQTAGAFLARLAGRSDQEWEDDRRLAVKGGQPSQPLVVLQPKGAEQCNLGDPLGHARRLQFRVRLFLD